MKRRRFLDVYASELPLEGVASLRDDELLSLFREIYARARKAGYHGCVFVARVGNQEWRLYREARRFDEAARKLRESGMECYSRCHLQISAQSLLKKALRTLRPLFDVISVEAETRAITAFGSRDHRVDLITLPQRNIPEILKGDIDEILKQGKFVEITLDRFFLGGSKPLDVAQVARVRETVKPLVDKGVGIVISSGPSSPYSPRDPRAVISFGEVFLGIKYENLSRWMSDALRSRIAENIYKRVGKIPARGVRYADVP